MKTTITRGDNDIPIEVGFTYSRGHRGKRDRYGAPVEPDEGPSIEIYSTVRLDLGEEIKLTATEEHLIEQQCWSEVEG
jgi:hypothetical protein